MTSGRKWFTTPRRSGVARSTAATLGIFLIMLVGSGSIQAKKPISKQGLLEAVRLNGLSTQELVRQVQQRGVSFQLTPGDESELREAGARPELIEAVRTNYRAAAPSPGPTNPRPTQPGAPVPGGLPLSKDQIIAMLQGGTSAARVEQFVEVRGVNFTLTPETSREITTAGGNRSLLGAISEKLGSRPQPAGPGSQPTGPASSSADYDDLTDQAQSAINTQNALEALRLLKQAVSINPTQPVAYQLLGIVQLYSLNAPAEAEKSMRAAIERGGEARFTVYHDHGGVFMFASFCKGSFFVSKSRVTFKANDGKHTFEAEDSTIKEAKLNKSMLGLAPGLKLNPFHIKVTQANGKSQNYNFAPATGQQDESALIVTLIQGYQ